MATIDDIKNTYSYVKDLIKKIEPCDLELREIITKDITEEQAESIVESHTYSSKLTTYRDYMFLQGTPDYENELLFDYMTAKESLKSLIKANELDIEKNYLILLKN